MEDNDWYESIRKEVILFKEKMPIRDYAAYELDALLLLAERISSLSHECSQCAEFKVRITNAIKGLADWPNTSKEQLKNYILTFRETIAHLDEYHKLHKGFLAQLFL